MQQCSSMLRMVDLRGQYEKIKSEVDEAISRVLCSSAFIQGPQVKEFEKHLSDYLGVKHVIGCGNGTDALQIALMALGLKAGDEVIVPAFTYVATAEVIGLLGLTPVLVDVEYGTFNVGVEHIRRAITPRTKAIVPVHLFGQSCDMEPILALAEEYGLWVVEDNAQAIGAEYRFGRQGNVKKTGTMGHIGCTSFFPSKNLGCYGDGGALMTDDDELALRIRMIANHGQREKYRHYLIGCNSRLDTIQAAVLDVKLKYIDSYNAARYNAARYYTDRLRKLDPQGKYFLTPEEKDYGTHVYHQYTLKIRGESACAKEGRTRDRLQEYLREGGIPSMVYYPLPLQAQEAFRDIAKIGGEMLGVSAELAASVLSLPMHTELTRAEQDRVVERIREFFKL